MDLEVAFVDFAEHGIRTPVGRLGADRTAPQEG